MCKIVNQFLVDILKLVKCIVNTANKNVFLLSLYLSLVKVFVKYITASYDKLNLKVQSFKLKYYRKMNASMKLLNVRSTILTFIIGKLLISKFFCFPISGSTKNMTLF